MKKIKLIKMDEINLNDKDYLQTKVYSDQLTDMLRDYYKSKSKEPLYIGVIGEWGSGKSTIVKTAISNLDKVTLFEYDAWKYEDDGFRRNFIKKMLDQSKLNKLSKDYNSINDSLYEDYSVSSNSIIERILLSRIKDKNYTGFWNHLFAFLFILLVLLLIIIGFIFQNSGYSILGVIISFLGSIGFFNVLYAETTYSKSKLFSPEQFYNTFEKILKLSHGKNNLIFIDNLDRCDGENLILTLKSIKGFYLEKDSNFNEKVAFVIPLDNNSVRNAYKIEDANHYIDKIFDNVIYLKNNNEVDKIDFINELLKEHPDIKDIFPESVMEVLTISSVKTPREMIKLINDYVTEYLILYRTKEEGFLDINENVNYLMKSVILNKKYHNFYEYAYKDLYNYMKFEQMLIDEEKSFIDEYGKECYSFLSITKDIKPTSYYDFYNNQKDKPYSLPFDLKNAIFSRNIDLIKKIDNKEIMINNFINGMHYNIKNSFWTIEIPSIFYVFVYLVKDNYFDKNEIDSVINKWNTCLFEDKKFYEEVVFRKIIEFEDILLFIKNTKPSNIFNRYIFEGLKNKKFSENKEENDLLIAKFLNKGLLNDIKEDDIIYINNYLLEACNNDYILIVDFISILDTNIVNYISVDVLKIIISKLNSDYAYIVVNIIDSLNKTKKEYDESFVNEIIYFLNNNSNGIIEYEELMNIISFVINRENQVNYLNSLNLSFGFSESGVLTGIDTFVDLYINNNISNDTFKQFVNYFKEEVNISNIIETFDNNLENMSQEFMIFYTNYIGNIGEKIFQKNINKIIKLYRKDKKNLMNLFKMKGKIKYVYNRIKNVNEKEEYINIAIDSLSSKEEQLNNLFLYESDPERFRQYIESEYSLLNMLLILERLEKKVNIELSINKIIMIIDGKDIINEEEYNQIIKCINKLNKTLSKQLSKYLKHKIDDEKYKYVTKIVNKG